MANFFDETYYLKSKLAQLNSIGETDANGKAYTLTTLKQAIADAGMTPESHYQQYGVTEHLNPNPYFNEVEYLEAKLQQLTSIKAKDADGKDYTMTTLKQAIADIGMTAAEHYEKYGSHETDASGNLINPSNAFDANAYVAAKLYQLQHSGTAAEKAQWADKTAADVVQAIADADMSLVSHYEAYGAKEANNGNAALVQTVPVTQRVSNDPARVSVTGEIVPANYNAPTEAPKNVTSADAAPVVKPADVGGLANTVVSPAVQTPTTPVAVPGDKGYVAPPANLVDTNANPVVIVQSDDGKPQFGVVSTDGKVNAVDDKGQVTDTVIGTVSGGEVKPVEPVAPTPTPEPDTTPSTPPAPNPTTTAVTATLSNNDATLTLTGNQSGTVTLEGVEEASDGNAAGDLLFTVGNGTPTNYKQAVTSIDASKVTNNTVEMLLEDYTPTGEKFVKITGSSGDDYINVKSSQMNFGDTPTVIDGNAGSDTLEILINHDGLTSNSGFFQMSDSKGALGTDDSGKFLYFDADQAKTLLGNGTTDGSAVKNIETLRLYSDVDSNDTNYGTSNAIIVVDSASVADTFKQFHFAENARVYNLTSDETVKNVSENNHITMALDAKEGISGTVNLDTAAPNYGKTTTITAVTAKYDSQDDYSTFGKLNITGQGNVVFDNSSSSVGVTINSSLKGGIATNDGNPYPQGTLDIKGGTAEDTITQTGTGTATLHVGSGKGLAGTGYNAQTNYQVIATVNDQGRIVAKYVDSTTDAQAGTAPTANTSLDYAKQSLNYVFDSNMGATVDATAGAVNFMGTNNADVFDLHIDANSKVSNLHFNGGGGDDMLIVNMKSTDLIAAAISQSKETVNSLTDAALTDIPTDLNTTNFQSFFKDNVTDVETIRFYTPAAGGWTLDLTGFKFTNEQHITFSAGGKVTWGSDVEDTTTITQNTVYTVGVDSDGVITSLAVDTTGA